MGLYTYSIPVKYAVELEGTNVSSYEDGTGYSGYKYLGAANAYGFMDEEVGITVNGWKLSSICKEVKSSRDTIHPDEFVKEGMSVCVLNESEYESVGEVFITAFSDDEESLRQFLFDFKLKGKIVKDIAVKQTT